MRYEDGSVIEERMQLSMPGHMDEAEEFCFEIALDTAIDPDKTAVLLLYDGGTEREIILGQTKAAQADTAGDTAGKESERNTQTAENDSGGQI